MIMSRLYERLSVAGQAERREAAAWFIGSLQNGSRARSAVRAFVGLCDVAIDETARPRPADEPSRPAWEFLAADSARLVLNAPRVRGFLKAIQRSPDATSVIDAGCGASALLSLAAAVRHPRSEVTAYELNSHAARCARRVVELFGLSDRIAVHNEDVMQADLPAADLGMTETFSSALLAEQGTRITARLGQHARELLPAFVVINACDVTVRDQRRAPWARAATLDLSETNELISGMVTSTGPGERPITVQASYYDAGHMAILDHSDVDAMTYPMPLGRITVPSAGSVIGFAYGAGSELDVSPPELWIER
jgi:hypothetical protein